jgi:hypothetical protein
LSKFDDPKASVKDKTQDVIKAALAPVALVPGVGTVITNVGNAAVDSAGYMHDILEGWCDPPPLSSNINMRSNPIGTIGNKIFNSTPFRNFFGKF